jgi:hypothetical protein
MACLPGTWKCREINLNHFGSQHNIEFAQLCTYIGIFNKIINDMRGNLEQLTESPHIPEFFRKHMIMILRRVSHLKLNKGLLSDEMTIIQGGRADGTSERWSFA